MSSKTAAVKLLEYLAVENPNLFVASVQPGVVDTYLLRKSGLDIEKLPLDSGEYPALFFVVSTVKNMMP